MSAIEIHQIFYSDQTRQLLDTGFIPLDNSRNERPDWREYWPIRHQLRKHPPSDDVYYGFFSPRFREKTGLDASHVYEFVRRCGEATDVVLFSPFFDQSAYFINSFEQAAAEHPNVGAAWSLCVSRIAPTFDAATAVMTSQNTVFCNYFVAKGRFWKQWLDTCESIFSAAETGHGEWARTLNAGADYAGTTVPAKVFIIERLASVMLYCDRRWQSRAHNPTAMKRGTAGFEREQVILDALKVAYTVQGYAQYMQAFLSLRDSVFSRLPQGLRSGHESR